MQDMLIKNTTIANYDEAVRASADGGALTPLYDEAVAFDALDDSAAEFIRGSAVGEGGASNNAPGKVIARRRYANRTGSKTGGSPSESKSRSLEGEHSAGEHTNANAGRRVNIDARRQPVKNYTAEETSGDSPTNSNSKGRSSSRSN